MKKKMKQNKTQIPRHKLQNAKDWLEIQNEICPPGKTRYQLIRNMRENELGREKNNEKKSTNTKQNVINNPTFCNLFDASLI